MNDQTEAHRIIFINPITGKAGEFLTPSLAGQEFDLDGNEILEIIRDRKIALTHIAGHGDYLGPKELNDFRLTIGCRMKQCPDFGF